MSTSGKQCQNKEQRADILEASGWSVGCTTLIDALGDVAK